MVTPATRERETKERNAWKNRDARSREVCIVFELLMSHRHPRVSRDAIHDSHRRDGNLKHERD